MDPSERIDVDDGLDGIETEAAEEAEEVEAGEDGGEEDEAEDGEGAEGADAGDEEAEDGGDGEGEGADGEGTGEAEDEELGRLGQRAQKRIRRLAGEVKDLRRELEEARKLGGDDGQTILSAAAKAGILPRLMTKELAEGLRQLDEKKDALAYFGRLLDSDDEDFEIGEKTYSRRQVERRERALKDEVQALEARHAKGRDKALEDTRGLIELGLAARKAGWKPGAKGEAKKVVRRETPRNVSIPRKAGAAARTYGYGDVGSDDELEAAIMAERRKARK